MVTFVTRAQSGLGVPSNNNGSTRPRLVTPVLGGIAVHYTGSPRRARNSTDPANVYMPWQQQVAKNAGKSFEYNYIIPPRADHTAQVWEYAGDYRAAHASGNNNTWVGVQFAIGVDNHPSYPTYDKSKPTVWEPLTDEMIEAFRWLRDEHLVPSGIVRPNPAILPHKQLPGAATACAGQAVDARWADLLEPYGGVMADKWEPRQQRLIDTRVPPLGSPMAHQQTITITVPNAGNAVAASVNLTVVAASQPGYFTAWPSGARPDVSSINFWSGVAALSNQIDVALSGGQFKVYASGVQAGGVAHLIVDLVGLWRP